MIKQTKNLFKCINVFPQLTTKNVKGNNGRIAVIGGSFQFTGAPYYSAISALKVGGDLAHIFCSYSSSNAIKSYSPQIIVHPIFKSYQQQNDRKERTQQQREIMYKYWLDKIQQWSRAIQCWIIGPGLGRDRYMSQFFPKLFKTLPQNCNIIIDADGIYYLCQNPNILNQLSKYRTIITPNHKELSYLRKFIQIDLQQIHKQYPNPSIEIEQIDQQYATKGITILIKGEYDIVLNEKASFIIRTNGGLKRCGGIGDILSGTVGVCSLWDYHYGPVLASKIVRETTKRAYDKEGRSLTAPNIIRQLAASVKDIEKELQ